VTELLRIEAVNNYHGLEERRGVRYSLLEQVLLMLLLLSLLVLLLMMMQ